MANEIRVTKEYSLIHDQEVGMAEFQDKNSRKVWSADFINTEIDTVETLKAVMKDQDLCSDDIGPLPIYDKKHQYYVDVQLPIETRHG